MRSAALELRGVALILVVLYFFFQAEDGIRDYKVTGVQTCALPILGETVEEIVGFAEAIRAAAVPLELPRNSTLDVSCTGRDALVDTCGTGGDASEIGRASCRGRV